MSCERVKYNVKLNEMKIKESFTSRKLKELENRINKAINHIEKHMIIYQSQYGEMSNFDYHLLNILRGSDNND